MAFVSGRAGRRNALPCHKVLWFCCTGIRTNALLVVLRSPCCRLVCLPCDGSHIFHSCGQVNGQMRPNNAFKPTPLRYAKHMAGRACHVLGSTTRRGLTYVLGLAHRLLAAIAIRQVAATGSAAGNGFGRMTHMRTWQRSEERRVGKESVSTGRYRG